MPNIYTHVDKNKRETFVVVALFILFVSAIGWLLGEFFIAQGSGLFVLGIALIFSGVSSFFTYYNSAQIVTAISGAKPINRADSKNEYLHDLVENLCIGAGLPMPKIYLIDDTAPNAFATGRDPDHAVICFTTGIIDKLDKLELEGVIAHELSHIGNYDIRLMSIVSILVGTVVLLIDFFTRGVFHSGRGSKSREGGGGGIILILLLIVLILSPIIATLIKLAISRNREYLADASGALLTRYPRGLASALRKISSDQEVLEAANSATAHMYIANPLKGSGRSFLSGLFNTHPPVEERIKRLQSM